jgi:hypothetical protein
MAFLPSIPQATDIIANSQSQILNNFTILGAIAGNSNTGSTTINNTAGFNFINLALQGSTVPSFNGNNGLWAGTYSVTGKNELWAQYQQGVSQYQYPISASILSNNPTPATQSDGWTYLPSGLIMKWGSSTGTAGNFIYTMPTGANIPVFTQALNVQVCVWETGNLDTNHAIRIINYTPTTINLWGSARTTTATAAVGFSWLAIGY